MNSLIFYLSIISSPVLLKGLHTTSMSTFECLGDETLVGAEC